MSKGNKKMLSLSANPQMCFQLHTQITKEKQVEYKFIK